MSTWTLACPNRRAVRRPQGPAPTTMTSYFRELVRRPLLSSAPRIRLTACRDLGPQSNSIGLSYRDKVLVVCWRRNWYNLMLLIVNSGKGKNTVRKVFPSEWGIDKFIQASGFAFYAKVEPVWRIRGMPRRINRSKFYF